MVCCLLLVLLPFISLCSTDWLKLRPPISSSEVLGLGMIGSPLYLPQALLLLLNKEEKKRASQIILLSFLHEAFANRSLCYPLTCFDVVGWLVGCFFLADLKPN